uniref:Senescence-related protein n=1 Tax=Chimonanthus praecox TaxID=13419 RepID=A0A0E3Z695_9MAGN|nr:senescence-related protein [Chimonanthus praecox]
MVSLGSSVLVPSVQELATRHKNTVPSRYLRPHQDPPAIDVSLPSIPIIDMNKLRLQQSSADELERLHSACKEWGFFQLINHGVSSSLIDKMKTDMKDLFNLPLEEKKKYWQQADDLEGFGNAFVQSEEQKLDWGDMFFLTTLPNSLRKPRLFDHLPSSFRETMEAYSMELQSLAMTVFGLMSRALGVKGDELNELFDGGFQSLRLNCYPPCPQPESVVGLSPHSDGGGLTILLQANEMEGLQVKKEGLWVPVKPLPNAFVINIGDSLEIITNGVYPSIEHRGMVNSTRERLSIAAFHNPKMTAEIGPLRSLISPENPALFRRVGAEKFHKDLFARKLKGKAFVDSMRVGHEEGSAAVATD